VIGAGPYGLSAAAHLAGQGTPTQVFGPPMEFWRNMPRAMYLKSPWSASSLSDPEGRADLNRYVQATGVRRQEPIPLPFFLDYAQWFTQQCVPDVDPTAVRRVSRDGAAFQVELVDGRRITAGRVVMAVGIRSFAHVPAFARDLPEGVASHTQAQTDFSRFRGRPVAVVGTGQSALEWAALLHEAGAEVELIVRGPVRWVSRRLYERTGPARHLFYPPTDVGPPGINWVVAFPLLVRRLPASLRLALHRRSVRPAGAKWLRGRVEGQIPVTASTPIVRAVARDHGVRIELADGSTRTVDYLFLGTGFRPDLERIAFLDPSLRAALASRNGFPILNAWFESSVPNLHFVGGVAGYNFGPLCNFVAGARVAARQLARAAARAA
jgi:thioredoxin reductase